jgi:hypothetical protein
MNAYDIVDRLHAVRSRGDGQWSARCPAHEDRGPSLSVKQLPDGRVLMHCFAGCGVDNVVGAIGLSLEDLFPPDVGYGHPPLAKRSLMSKGQALELLASESMFVAVAAANVSKGLDLSADDKDRLLKSAGRIALLQREASL